jgi:hypothetical protein
MVDNPTTSIRSNGYEFHILWSGKFIEIIPPSPTAEEIERNIQRRVEKLFYRNYNPVINVGWLFL